MRSRRTNNMPTVVTTVRRRTGRATSRHGAWPSRARPARVHPTASATWDVTDLVFGRGRLLLLNEKNHTFVDDHW